MDSAVARWTAESCCSPEASAEHMLGVGIQPERLIGAGAHKEVDGCWTGWRTVGVGGGGVAARGTL